MKNKLNKFIEWIMYMIGYSLVLMSVSMIFKNSLYIDHWFFGIWSFLANVIIYVLNKTVKPLIVWLTLPITALTLGLFYPVINILILYVVSFILGNHFIIHGGPIMIFIIAVLLSIMNFIMKSIIEKLIKEDK